VQVLSRSHPDVPLYLAAVDSHLNAQSYIVPGLRKLNPHVETKEDREQRREADEATRRLHKRLGIT
jgi:hypothetical protein